jgi:hypothetical protein
MQQKLLNVDAAANCLSSRKPRSLMARFRCRTLLSPQRGTTLACPSCIAISPYDADGVVGDAHCSAIVSRKLRPEVREQTEEGFASLEISRVLWMKATTG